MSTWSLALAGALYVLAALDFYTKGQKGFALAFVAYALANVGFIAASKSW